MALRETRLSSEVDLFRQELVNLIDLRHPLVQLAQKIDWKFCEMRFGGLYATGIGRPRHPLRLMVGLMVGLQLLKQPATCPTRKSWPSGSRTATGNTSAVSSTFVTTCPSIRACFRKQLGEASRAAGTSQAV